MAARVVLGTGPGDIVHMDSDMRGAPWIVAYTTVQDCPGSHSFGGPAAPQNVTETMDIAGTFL